MCKLNIIHGICLQLHQIQIIVLRSRPKIKLPNYCDGNIEVTLFYKTNTLCSAVKNKIIEFLCSGLYGSQKFIYNKQIFNTAEKNDYRFTNNVSFYLFAVDVADVYPNQYFNGRIYEAYFKDNGVKKRHFIPALDTNGKPCMFDLVSQTPFYNERDQHEFGYKRVDGIKVAPI